MSTEPDTTPAPTPAPAPAPAAPQQPSSGRTPRPARTQKRQRLTDVPPPKPSWEHPLFAAEASLVAGGLGHVVELPGTAGAIGGGIVTATATVATAGRWHHGGSTIFSLAVGGSATGWLAWVLETTPWAVPQLGALALGTLAGGPLYGLLRHRHEKADAKEVERRAEQRAERKRHQWEQVLHAAGAKGIVIDQSVNDDTWTHGERKFPAGFALALDLGDNDTINEARDLTSYLPKIEKQAKRLLNLRLLPGSVQVQPREYAGEAELIVATTDVMNETVHMDDDHSPRSINDPLLVARLVDGTLVGPNLQQDPHGMFSGQTNFGKTTFLDAHIKELTRCTDNVTWAICGNKPSRFFASWMAPFFEAEPDPYTGAPCQPIFDWIAGTYDEAWNMLCDAYKAVKYRQSTAAASKDEKWHATNDAPAITIVIDESPDLLSSTIKYKAFDGEFYSVSDLILQLTRLARSENIHVIFLTQRGTLSLLGPEGGSIKSQIGYRAGFRATTGADINAVFASNTTGVRLDSLPAGGLYFELNSYNQPVLAKGLFMAKEAKIECARQHSRYARPVDAATAEVMDFYADRWTSPSQLEFFEDLSHNRRRTNPYDTATPATAVAAEPAAPAVADAPAEPTEPAPAPDDEVRMLEDLYAAPAADRAPDDHATGGPAEPDENAILAAVSPDLPDDTRQLLALLATSDLLYTDDDHVLTTELAQLAADQLGWDPHDDGGRRIPAALREINIEQLARRRVGGRRGRAFRTADLRTAVDMHVRPTDDAE